VAYIGSGRISRVNVINSGTGYTKTPTVFINGGGAVKTTATFYAELVNNTVRKNTVTIKFDRISTSDQIGDLQVTDRFICNGSQNEFVLNWLAQPNKQTINVTLDSDLVLVGDYTISYYTELFNGYYKQYSKIIFLNYIPKFNQVLTVHYEKNVELMTAIERLGHFTNMTDFSTVTSGLVYPQTTLTGVPFGHTSAWAEPYPNYDTFAWDDDVANYTSKEVISSSDSIQFPGFTSVAVQSTADIRLYQYANIISIPTMIFDIHPITTGTLSTSSLQVAAIGAGYVVLNGKINYVLPNARDLNSNDVIEFWSNDSNFSILDEIVQGGAWSTSTNSSLTSILGINPADVSRDPTSGLYFLGGTTASNITVDGDGYYTENTGYSPEELLLGQATDSLGINVYTRNLNGSPTIYSNSAPILPGVRADIFLTVLPPDVDSITVIFNNSIFQYNPDTGTTDAFNYSIDWENSLLIIPPQLVGGLVGYTVVTIGGGGYIDTESLVVAEGNASAQVTSLAAETTVQYVYVSVDGKSISTATSFLTPYYSFGYSSPNNRRAAVNIYNLTTTTAHLVQAWFFSSPYEYVNVIDSQSFLFNISTTNTFVLAQPPGPIGPPEANVIIEVIDSSGISILQPPDIKYYEITDINETFPLITNNIKVYRNGLELTFGFDYTINLSDRVGLINGVANVGDVIAIVSYIGGTFYDYYIDGNSLVINKQGPNIQSIPNYNAGGLATIKAITYSGRDNLIRKETFNGNTSGRYVISRPVINSNYLWVTIEENGLGIGLINNVDFVILEDQVTVQLSQQFANDRITNVIITSIASNPLADTVLGYRMFTDMFNNTQFKRLSAENTTYLTQSLNFNDTEIHVANAGVLSQPLVSKKIPGVVIIGGERIEFFKIRNNTLSQLRRGTLGTAPSFYIKAYTKVIDQGINQTVPYTEKIYKQSYINLGTTNTYIISKTPQSVYYEKVMIEASSTSTAVLNGNTYYNNLDSIQILINGQPIDQTTSTYTIIPGGN
jgi:hypothetical protein